MGLKILLVDDNIDFTFLLQLIVRELGHEVAVAHTGSQAVAKVKNFHPDLVFVDLHLPDRPGARLSRILRRYGGPDLRIIGLSGCAPEDAAKKISGSCIAFCLLKPLGLGALRRGIADAIARVDPDGSNMSLSTRRHNSGLQDQVQGQ